MKEILAALVAAFLVFGCTGYGASQQNPAVAPQATGAGATPPANPGSGDIGAQGAGASPPDNTSGAAPPPPAPGGGPTGTQNSGVLFASSQYAQTAVMIYPGSTTGQSSGEIPNFNMDSVPQPDGSVKITMTEKSGGQALTAFVPLNGAVYFNDANLGDDAAGSDKYLQDDTLIAVDGNGYIVAG